MNTDSIKKMTLTVNTSILIMVLGLMWFFHVCGAVFLVWFSIPTIMVYLIGFWLIKENRLHVYVWMVYAWLMLYMSVGTVCLGYLYGFHLYSMSMIPIIYYTNYMAYKTGQKMIKTGMFSAAIIICYLGCTVYVAAKGPVYDGSEISAAVFWIINSAIVFGFLITYTRIMINSIIASEEKLKNLSFNDRLTGLYNRHYMVDLLEKMDSFDSTDVIAMADLDDFKKINDVYGHNAGDLVLVRAADIMKKTCTGCVISRWGGEEFLILIKGGGDPRMLMEKLRKSIESESFVFEKNRIPVSLTIGIAAKDGNKSADKWIQKADDNLYIGKKNGKNAVIG